MNKRQSILRILTANLFLLALLAQSVHQIRHLSHHTADELQFHQHENCHHASHITEKNHCEFCDFTFSPTVEFAVQLIDIPVIFDEINSLINVELPQHFVSQYLIHKKLRGPPFYA